MIRAIVFDCFGVLATEGWGPFKYKHFRDNEELRQQASELMRATNSGRLGYREFLTAMGRMTKLRPEQVERELHGNVPDTQLFDYMTELKPHYKLGLLSNAGGNWLAQIFTPDQLKLLDAVALSYETGFIKPEAEAYRLIAERLGVPVGECLLVDDQARFCVAAEAAGMRAFTYADAAQFERELPAALKRG